MNQVLLPDLGVTPTHLGHRKEAITEETRKSQQYKVHQRCFPSVIG